MDDEDKDYSGGGDKNGESVKMNKYNKIQIL